MTTKVSSTDIKTLQASTTRTADYHGSGLLQGLQRFTDLIVTLDVTAIDVPDSYDFYITTGDGVSEWDIIHFPQITVVADPTGVVRYTAIVSGKSRPVNTTTATPGVEAVTSATLETTTAAVDHGYGTLAAGMVRHGPWGDRLGYYMKCANPTMSITYSITVTPKP